MNWITVIWPMGASACITIALIHLVIWLNDRKNYVHLLFAAAALSVVGIAVCELQMMTAQTPEQLGRWIRWTHVPLFAAIVFIVWFVQFYFQSGRLWLAWSVCAARFLALVLNFVLTPNLNYTQITAVRQMELFRGATVSIPEGVLSPWTRVGELSSLLLLAFVLDASITLWRRGDRAGRHRAVVIGGSLVFFILAAAGHGALIHWGLIKSPYLISLTFLVPVAAMGYELGIDVVQSARIARELDENQAKLREDENRLEVVAIAAEFGMWRWNVAKDEIWMSETGRALFNLAGSEPINLDRLLEVLHPDDHQAFIHSFSNSMTGNGDYQCEFRVLLPDGGLRWIAGHGRAEFNNGQSKPAFLRSVALDITARKQAEELLRESEARFQDLANTVPMMIWKSGPDKLCTFFNKGWLEFTGRTMEQEQGNGWAEGVHSEDFDHCFEIYANSFDARREFAMEYRLRRSDGEYRWILDTGAPQFNSGGDFLGYIGFVVDISERRKAEHEHMRQRNELAHLSRVAMLGELSGSLAHELNQPLTSILSNAQAAQAFLSQDSQNLDEVRAILQDIVDEDRRAREVISRLRLLFRKGEIHFEAIDLNELVLEVLKVMNSDLINHGVKVQTDLSADLPNVRGDRVQLQQVLINLIINASDAMSGNDDTDRKLCVATRQDEDGTVRMSVSDAGCGIPADQIERIFEPFHTTKATGMGLGLAVCRTIIAAHAGKLWAANNSVRGACFHTTVPSVPTGVP